MMLQSLEPQVLMIMAIATPFFAAAGINLFGAWKNIREIFQLISSVALVFFIICIYVGLMQKTSYEANLINVFPGIGIAFSIEPLGLVYAAIAALLWPISIIYSSGYLRLKNDSKQTQFFIYFALSIASAIGIAFSANLLTMFIFYELLTLLTFPLVIHNGGLEVKRAGRIYLGYLLGASVLLLLPAIAAIYFMAGTLDFTTGGLLFNSDIRNGIIMLVFLMFLFGTAKAALMPMHKWLPEAMVAPAPVSGLLHAVAVVKAGVFVIGKIIIYIFGADNIELASVSKEFALYLAAATIVISGIFALREPSIKKRLAYSTIANLACIILAFMVLSKAGVVAAGAHMVSHALGKITLFFAAGAIIMLLGINNVQECNGLAKKSRVLFICFFLCSLSIIGLPFFAGGYSKELILIAAREADMVWVIYVLYVGMLLTIGYLMPISYRAFICPITPGGQKMHEKPGRHYLMKGAVVATTSLTLVFPLYEKYITALLQKVII